MDSHTIFQSLSNISVIIFLVLLNAFFVAAEFSLVKIRASKVTQLISEGIYRAKFVKTVTTHLDAYLSACQLGITLASLGLGWLGEKYVDSMIRPLFSLFMPGSFIEPISYGISFALITILHIVLGELSPKSIAIQKTEKTALWLAPPLILFFKLTYPAIWLLNALSSATLKLLGMKPSAEIEQAHTEEEIRILVTESEKSGIIDQEEKVLFDNVFQFSDRVAREAMVPRTSMVVLYLEDTFDEILKIASQTRHTRYPVAQEDKDNIVGFIHVSDLYGESLKTSDRSIQNILRSILRVPEFMELSQVLQIMKKNRVQIAVVTEEYGGTAGLLTLEDILEEIVGEIQDEFDTTRPVFEQTEKGYSMDGRMLISDVNNMLNLAISNEDVDTIGGWVHMMLESEEPKVGKSIVHDTVQFEIEEVDKDRIVRLNVFFVSESESNDVES